jgi:hypothetical protein
MLNLEIYTMRFEVENLCLTHNVFAPNYRMKLCEYFFEFFQNIFKLLQDIFYFVNFHKKIELKKNPTNYIQYPYIIRWKNFGFPVRSSHSRHFSFDTILSFVYCLHDSPTCSLFHIKNSTMIPATFVFLSEKNNRAHITS